MKPTEIARKTLHPGLGSIEAWAGRMVEWPNCLSDGIRFVKRQQGSKLMEVPLLEEDMQNREMPRKSLSRRQLFEDFMSKMSRIPEKRRVPLLLHLAYGYTVGEVSEVTEVSPNTVKDRLKTAFLEFQSILDEDPSLVATMLEELR
jgi:DNA-directed RNA polymerase specialized sigma24 family protein